MKRVNKDYDKDESVAIGMSAGSITNNSTHNSSADSNDANASNTTTVRTTGRVKKPKLVYDPSDNYISRAPRHSMPAAYTQQSVSATGTKTDITNASSNNGIIPSIDHMKTYDTCMKCGKSELKRGSGFKSNFLTCKTCTMKWHFDCLPISFDNLSIVRKKFKCEKCRHCGFCIPVKNPKSQREMLMCSGCADVYHLDCHFPPLLRAKLYDPKWKCRKCDVNYNMIEVGHDDTKRSKNDSILLRKSSIFTKKQSNADVAGINGKLTTLKLEKTDKSADSNRAARPASTPSASTSSLLPALLSPVKKDKKSLHSSAELNFNVQKLISTKFSAKKQLQQQQQQQKQKKPPVQEVQEPMENAQTQPEPKQNKLEKDAQNEPQAQPQPTTTANDSLLPDIDLPVQCWTVDQVVNFIRKRYPQEANIFKFQDIDGASLMLLTRQDIIDRFGLKLGPSLRLFQLVTALQNHSDDLTLTWVK